MAIESEKALPEGPLARATLVASRVVHAARGSVERLVRAAALEAAVSSALARGYFRPNEEELLDEWFARALTLRRALWESVESCSAALGGDMPSRVEPARLRCFLAGYAAACLIARLDRYLVEQLATDPLVQRKLNEARPAHRIPRKQFTRIFESLTDPEKALRMKAGIDFVQAHLGDLEALRADLEVGAFVRELEELEAPLDTSKRRYFNLAWAYIQHSWARRGASARQRTTAGALEGGGRVVSELRDTFRAKRLNASAREYIAAHLEPGDVIVTRHDLALTNLFLPGFWPHAALYVGTPAQRELLGVRLGGARAARAGGAVCTLEALKDGVRFRGLHETLAVDAAVVIRPQVRREWVARAIERAAQHEGKDYNFDFDFFRADRLVCTEVVFRAFDGIENFELPLVERAGRPSLSAEDLLDHALAGTRFEPLAIYGVGEAQDSWIMGSRVAETLAASYTRR